MAEGTSWAPALYGTLGIGLSKKCFFKDKDTLTCALAAATLVVGLLEIKRPTVYLAPVPRLRAKSR